ncbi:MAG TPA: MBL fold metallo-hydrolase [Caulobacteraceae bacterium]|jgi:flavorubredoxin|nr:MBL fold metallo-hydrolase [Caulobacteraceae bacterium]
MQTRIDEIAAGLYRLSTHVPEITPDGFTFNQFLLDADEPLLFHCGHRRMFPLISAAAARIMPLERLRWIGFGHVEADECGAMNQWLAAAPHAQVAHGQVACDVSLNDMADRPPRPLADGETIDLGGKRVRFVYTPHVPHGWEAGVLYEETAGVLLCGDLFSHAGDGPAITGAEVLAPAIHAEDMFHAMCLGPDTGPMLRKLADLSPGTLALMHGSSFTGDGAAALRGLADHYGGGMGAGAG